MSDNKNDSHPFDEDILKQALSEPLETSSHSGQANSGHDESVEPLYDQSKTAASIEEDHYGPIETNDEFNDLDSENSPKKNRDNGMITANTSVEDTNSVPDIEDTFNPATLSEPYSSGDAKSTNRNGLSRIVITVIALSAVGFTVSNWMANQKIDALTVQLENIETQMSNRLNADADQAVNEKEQQAVNPDQGNEAILMQLTAQIMGNREAIKALKQSITEITSQNSADTAMIMTESLAVGPEDSAASPATRAAAMDIPSDTIAREIVQTAKESSDVKQDAVKLETAAPVSDNKGQNWNIALISLKSEKRADREIATLLKNGIQAEKHTVEVHGETFYQLRTGGFEQIDDARAYIKNVITDLGYGSAWVRHM